MRRGGSCSFPEETGEEQEVLLRGEEKEPPYQRDVSVIEGTVLQMTDEHIQCEFFF